MAALDADRIRAAVHREALDRLAQIEVFAEIDSTNSYLLQSAGPAPGKIRVAVTANQTAGRGQRGRRWHAPKDSGVCLSLAYTYASQPENLSSLTLAIGVSAITALSDEGISGVQLKWPNDLVADNGKLGGILTEAQQQSTGAVTVVTGIGVNVRLPEAIPVSEGSEWAGHIADLAGISDASLDSNRIAGALVSRLCEAFVAFEADGFSSFLTRWQACDWLDGREITVETVDERISGIGAGVSADGALLVAARDGLRTVTSGTVIRAARCEAKA